MAPSPPTNSLPGGVSATTGDEHLGTANLTGSADAPAVSAIGTAPGQGPFGADGGSQGAEGPSGLLLGVQRIPAGADDKDESSVPEETAGGFPRVGQPDDAAVAAASDSSVPLNLDNGGTVADGQLDLERTPVSADGQTAPN